jgi:hypothetical protein
MSDQLQVAGRRSGVWSLRRCKPDRVVPWYAADPVLAGLPSLPEFASRLGLRAGQEFLINSDGRIIPRLSRLCGEGDQVA